MASDMLQKILEAEKEASTKLSAATEKASLIVKNAEEEAKASLDCAKKAAFDESDNRIAESNNEALGIIDEKKSLAVKDASIMRDEMASKKTACVDVVINKIIG